MELRSNETTPLCIPGYELLGGLFLFCLMPIPGGPGGSDKRAALLLLLLSGLLYLQVMKLIIFFLLSVHAPKANHKIITKYFQ